jgi:hypothetical protein
MAKSRTYDVRCQGEVIGMVQADSPKIARATLAQAIADRQFPVGSTLDSQAEPAAVRVEE